MYTIMFQMYYSLKRLSYFELSFIILPLLIIIVCDFFIFSPADIMASTKKSLSAEHPPSIHNNGIPEYGPDEDTPVESDEE